MVWELWPPWDMIVAIGAFLYTSPRAAARGLPAKAFAITARPDHLLHYVIDAIERERI